MLRAPSLRRFPNPPDATLSQVLPSPRHSSQPSTLLVPAYRYPPRAAMQGASQLALLVKPHGEMRSQLPS